MSPQRQSIGIPPTNNFVFAALASNESASGWHDFDKLCLEAKMHHKLNATKMRHHIATIMKERNFSQEETLTLCSKFGHSVKIHDTIYACPPAVKSILLTTKK